MVRQLAEKFLDNFLKKTIILNELANAKTFVLREKSNDFSSEQFEIRYHIN